MDAHDAVGRGMIALNWKLLAGVGAVSVLTMALTAVWFLLAGVLVLVGVAIAAVLRPFQAAQLLSDGGSVALGLLVGPVIYLGLAFLT